MASPDAHFNVGLGDAMEITSAGHEEVALFSKVEVFSGLAGTVRAVVDFNPTHPGILQLAKQHAQTFARMS